MTISACDLGASQHADNTHTSTITVHSSGSSAASTQSITYSTNAQDVLIRTFYGGGLSGSLELSPDISMYGDGTFILGTEKTGKLDSDALHQLLNTLVDTYGLLNFKREQFIDTPDQNASYLELTLNNKQYEFAYGPFGNEQESAQDMDEYHRLHQAFSAITNALQGSIHPYQGSSYALLARQIFNPSPNQSGDWPLSDYTLAQVAATECGLLPPDETSPNKETGCLKYVIPQKAVLLTAPDYQALKGQLGGGNTGIITESGLYYAVVLRPLLPDELPRRALAMFGSNQSEFHPVPLLIGAVPPVPTPTPST